MTMFSVKKWIAHTLVMGVVLGGATLVVPGGARADDVEDGLKKIKDQAECRSRCNADSLACMGRCPNGNPGASCRGNCLLDANSCSQRCN